MDLNPDYHNGPNPDYHNGPNRFLTALGLNPPNFPNSGTDVSCKKLLANHCRQLKKSTHIKIHCNFADLPVEQFSYRFNGKLQGSFIAMRIESIPDLTNNILPRSSWFPCNIEGLPLEYVKHQKVVNSDFHMFSLLNDLHLDHSTLNKAVSYQDKHSDTQLLVFYHSQEKPQPKMKQSPSQQEPPQVTPLAISTALGDTPLMNHDGPSHGPEKRPTPTGERSSPPSPFRPHPNLVDDDTSISTSPGRSSSGVEDVNPKYVIENLNSHVKVDLKPSPQALLTLDGKEGDLLEIKEVGKNTLISCNYISFDERQLDIASSSFTVPPQRPDTRNPALVIIGVNMRPLFVHFRYIKDLSDDPAPPCTPLLTADTVDQVHSLLDDNDASLSLSLLPSLSQFLDLDLQTWFPQSQTPQQAPLAAMADSIPLTRDALNTWLADLCRVPPSQLDSELRSIREKWYRFKKRAEEANLDPISELLAILTAQLKEEQEEEDDTDDEDENDGENHPPGPTNFTGSAVWRIAIQNSGQCPAIEDFSLLDLIKKDPVPNLPDEDADASLDNSQVDLPQEQVESNPNLPETDPSLQVNSEIGAAGQVASSSTSTTSQTRSVSGRSSSISVSVMAIVVFIIMEILFSLAQEAAEIIIAWHAEKIEDQSAIYDPGRRSLMYINDLPHSSCLETSCRSSNMLGFANKESVAPRMSSYLAEA